MSLSLRYSVWYDWNWTARQVQMKPSYGTEVGVQDAIKRGVVTWMVCNLGCSQRQKVIEDRRVPIVCDENGGRTLSKTWTNVCRARNSKRIDCRDGSLIGLDEPTGAWGQQRSG